MVKCDCVRVGYLQRIKQTNVQNNMEASEIMRSVNRLSLPQQMLIAERIIHSIRKKEQPSLEVAAERLCADYMNDENLTVFTQLDCEDFYETR